jgi:hypothetical protein
LEPVVTLVSLVGLVDDLWSGPERGFRQHLRAGSRARGEANEHGSVPARAPEGCAVFLLPYDLRQMGMLGDAGSNALGAMLGLKSVSRLTGRGRAAAIAVLAGLTTLGERRSLGSLIERSWGLRALDAAGRRFW